MYAPIYGITVIEAESYSNRSDALAAIKNRVFEPITGTDPGKYDSTSTYENQNSLRHAEDHSHDATVGTDPAMELLEGMRDVFDENNPDPTQAPSDASLTDVTQDIINSFTKADPSDISPDMSREELEDELGVDIPAVDPTQADASTNMPTQDSPTDNELDHLVEKAESVEDVIAATSEDAVTPGAKLYRQIGNRIKNARKEETDTSIEGVCNDLDRNPVTDNVVVASINSPAGKLLFEDAWVHNIQGVTREAYSHDNRGDVALHEVPLDKYSDRLSTVRTRIFTDGEQLPETVVSHAERDRVIEFAETSDADVWIAPAMAHF